MSTTLRAVSAGPLADRIRALAVDIEELPRAEANAARAEAARLIALLEGHLGDLSARPVGKVGLPRLLNAHDVADRLGVPEKRVYELARSILAPAAVKLGEGTLRFNPEALEKIILAQTGTRR